jgi:hypothetical protein
MVILRTVVMPAIVGTDRHGSARIGMPPAGTGRNITATCSVKASDISGIWHDKQIRNPLVNAHLDGLEAARPIGVGRMADRGSPPMPP